MLFLQCAANVRKYLALSIDLYANETALTQEFAHASTYINIKMHIWANLFTVIQCQPLPEKEYGNWRPDRNNVTTQTELECWDNATLSNDVNNSLTCLMSGEWDNDPSSLFCRSKL